MQRPWVTVVGIVGDVKHNGIEGTVKEKFYVPHRQWHKSATGFAIRSMTLVIKTSGDPLAMAGAGARVGARDGRLGADRQRALARRSCVALDRDAAVHRLAARALCHARARAVGDRPLRRAVVSREPAAARDRHSHGARRRAAGRAAHGAWPRPRARPRRRRRRSGESRSCSRVSCKGCCAKWVRPIRRPSSSCPSRSPRLPWPPATCRRAAPRASTRWWRSAPSEPAGTGRSRSCRRGRFRRHEGPASRRSSCCHRPTPPGSGRPPPARLAGGRRSDVVSHVPRRSVAKPGRQRQRRVSLVLPGLQAPLRDPPRLAGRALIPTEGEP